MPENSHVRFGEGDDETYSSNGERRIISTLHSRALYPHKGAGHFGALCNADPTVWANFRGRISSKEQFSGARSTFPLQRLDVPIWPFGENFNPSVGQ